MAADERPERLTLPDGFPTKLTDAELDEAVDLLLQATTRFARTDLRRFKGEILAPVLQLGVLEQSRRQSRASARHASIVSYCAVAVAAFALAVAVVFGGLDYYGDKDWQDDQTRLLTEIRDRPPAP